MEESKNYQGFHSAGWLRATPGNVTDFGEIKDDLLELSSEVQINEAAYDPYQATQFASELYSDHGMPMIELGATVRNFSEPMKRLQALVISGKIQFQNDPVLRWMFGNVVATLDRKDNIYPNKESVDKKIDGPVALIMAMNRAISGGGDDNVYDYQGGLMCV